ncbi:hypothetical protein ACVWXO_006098 [Bradyrhizobium sp. LM2.7]
MDATSIVTSYPALAEDVGAIAGAALAAQIPAGEGATKVALSPASRILATCCAISRGGTASTCIPPAGSLRSRRSAWES